MKPFRKTILTALVVMLAFAANAQTSTKKTTTTKTKSKTTTTKHAAPAAYGKVVQFTLKNLAEGTIPIFAGPKEDLQDIQKRKTVGGLSTNKMSLRANEVVCIVNGKKTVSCGIVKPTTTQMEINISGTAIEVK